MNWFKKIFDRLPGDQRVKDNIREWIESIVIALVLAMIVRTFLVQAFSIPSGSMRPTLVERDRILANKLIYRFNDPKRGDIVIFKYPEDRSKYYVKRLIGKPGESIQIKDGDIYVNGELYDGNAKIAHNYYYSKGVFGSDGEPVKVPDGYYYVLGDNSASSKDSRYWGFVPRKDITGRAFFIYWPLTRIGRVE